MEGCRDCYGGGSFETFMRLASQLCLEYVCASCPFPLLEKHSYLIHRKLSIAQPELAISQSRFAKAHVSVRKSRNSFGRNLFLGTGPADELVDVLACEKGVKTNLTAAEERKENHG
jgi:hypothetical protein